VPPSVNTLAYAHWRKTRAHKQAWQRDLGMLLLSERLPRPLLRVDAWATIRFRQRRQRDEGNFRFLIEKSLGDALVAGGWLPDDTPEHFSFGSVEFDPQTGPARTMVHLSYTREGRHDASDRTS